MLTIKAEIKSGEQKVDGTYNVKLRFTLDRKVKRLVDRPNIIAFYSLLLLFIVLFELLKETSYISIFHHLNLRKVIHFRYRNNKKIVVTSVSRY